MTADEEGATLSKRHEPSVFPKEAIKDQLIRGYHRYLKTPARTSAFT